ncbi:MAG TPA: hypothetical protein VNB54_07370 [Alphaproteobacteria bacterium]|nr:hypothetical protein [Alphaproteobacteria bacterium]
MAKLFEDTHRYLYPGRITLFRAKDRDEIIADGIATTNGNVTDALLSKGWSNFTSQPVELRWIPGTHETCVKEPNVKTLARELVATIEAHKASHATNKSRSRLPVKSGLRSYELNTSIWQIRDMEAISGDD